MIGTQNTKNTKHKRTHCALHVTMINIFCIISFRLCAEESSQETYSQPLRSTSAPQTTISTTTAKTVPKPTSTIPSNTDDRLNKPHSYSQSRPSLAPPNVS